MTILVTGATGNIGRPLIRYLVEAGASVRAISRSPSRAALPVQTVAGDPSQPHTLNAVFDGVSTVFLNPRALGTAAAEFVDVAKRHGVRRLVVLAAINVDDDRALQPSRFRGDRNREAEQAAVASGLDWVSLRPTTFASNTIGQWGAQIRTGDVVRWPYPHARAASVAERDVADVAARALLSDEYLHRSLVLTGPAALTPAEQVAAIGAAIGRDLRFDEESPDMTRERMTRFGFPPDFVTALLAATVDTPPQVTADIEKVLARPAQDFASLAREHAAAFTA